MSDPDDVDLPALLGGKPAADFADFPRDRVSISERCVEAGVRLLRSGAWSMFTSPEVADFEAEFAHFVGARHAVLVNSCTTAILASLMALDVGAGDYVALPAYTYIGSCMPVLALGARPVLVDIDPHTASMDVAALREALHTYPIRAVIHVHLFGSCQDAVEVAELCSSRGAAYVADCAQFLGDRHATGLLAESGPTCFSFGESKLLRLGEGGAVTTNSDELAERLRLARHEGELWTRLRSSRLVGTSPTPSDVLRDLASAQQGLNFRPLAIVAAMGRVMLEELPSRLSASAANAARLSFALASHPALVLPQPGPRTWWTYPLCINHAYAQRDVVLAAMLAEGIPVGVHFPRLIADHPIVKERGSVLAAPISGAKQFADSHLVLPIYEGLCPDHIDAMSAALRKVLGHTELLRSSEAWVRAEALLTKHRIDELCDGLFMFLTHGPGATSGPRTEPN